MTRWIFRWSSSKRLKIRSCRFWWTWTQWEGTGSSQLTIAQDSQISHFRTWMGSQAKSWSPCKNENSATTSSSRTAGSWYKTWSCQSETSLGTSRSLSVCLKGCIPSWSVLITKKWVRWLLLRNLVCTILRGILMPHLCSSSRQWLGSKTLILLSDSAKQVS